MVLTIPISIVEGFFGMNVGGIGHAKIAMGSGVVVLPVARFTEFTGCWPLRRRK